MTVLPSELQDVFGPIEEKPSPLAEYDVSSAVNEIVKKRRDASEAVTSEMLAEAMAFDFSEDYQNEETSWGTYYGPMMVVPREGGSVERPSLQLVTPEILSYWEQRAKEAKHPVLKARYADLVWDLSQKATNQRAGVGNAHNAIGAYTETIERGLYKNRRSAVTYAERALMLAVSLTDKKRIKKVRDAVLALDAAEAPDENGAGIAFDLLVSNKKVQLPKKSLEKLIGDQEQIMALGVGSAEEEKGFPLSVDRSAERLMTYYQSHKAHDEVKRVGEVWARAKIAMARRASPMVGAAWLRETYTKLVDFECSEEAESVAAVIRDLSKKSMDEMVEHTADLEISKKDLDDWTNRMLGEDIHDALRHMVAYFLPDPDQIKKDVIEQASKTPLLSFLTLTQVDAEGREIAQIGAIKDDLEGRVIQHMGENLQLKGPFLRHLIQELVRRYGLDADRLLDEIMKSPTFRDDRMQTIKRGVEAILIGDHVLAASLLIPQIEHALRLLVVSQGGSAYSHLNRRTGGFQLKTLGQLLNDPGVTQVLGDRVVMYFQVVLTDPRGWNLRNDLLHGILNPDDLGWGSTDRILHMILLLGSIRAEEEPPPLSTQGC